MKRFDRDSVAVMIAALAGKVPPDAIVDAVFDETEGNAFFVEEVFWHLVEERKVFDESGEFRTDLAVDELDVPESVRLVVGRRLERLGPESQRVLAAAAVVGRAFPFTLLEAITTDVDAWRLLDIVEEAEAAKVVVPEERDGAVHYSFAHELIRQTLLSGLSLLRRQRLHLAIADAIERTDRTAASARPSEIAHHLLLAGAGVDPERTLGYLERTADRALEAAAFEEALRALDDAIVLAGDGDAARRAKLLERKGHAVRALGRFEECLTIWDEVVTVDAAVGETDTAALLCWEMGSLYVWLDRFPEAFATYARGIELLGDERSSLWALLAGATATVLGLAGLYEQAEPQFAEALPVAEAAGDERTLGRMLWGRTIAKWSNSRLAEALEDGRASIAHLRRAGDAWTLVDALAWTAYPATYTGFVAEGRDLAQEAIDLGQRVGNFGGEILGRRAVAFANALETADLEEFERGAREDLAAFESIRSPWVSQSHAWLSRRAPRSGGPRGLAAPRGGVDPPRARVRMDGSGVVGQVPRPRVRR